MPQFGVNKMKNKIKTYARRLTRDDLIRAGITYVSENGDVYKGDKKVKFSVNRKGYLYVGVYKLDENGNKIKRQACCQ